MRVNLGSNVIQNCEAALVVNGVEVFRLRDRAGDGQLVCDFDVRGADGERIAKIAKNNAVYAAPGWKVVHLPRESRVEDTQGNVIAQVLETGEDEIAVTGEFWVEGHRVQITEDALVSGGITMAGNLIDGFGRAISLEPNSFSIGVV